MPAQHQLIYFADALLQDKSVQIDGSLVVFMVKWLNIRVSRLRNFTQTLMPMIMIDFSQEEKHKHNLKKFNQAVHISVRSLHALYECY